MQDLEFFCSFCFFGKTAPCGKILKILFQNFSLPHRSTLLYSNVVKFVRQEINEIVLYLPYKKFQLPLKLLLLCGSRPKSARASPQHLAHNVPNFIQIGSLVPEL